MVNYSSSQGLISSKACEHLDNLPSPSRGPSPSSSSRPTFASLQYAYVITSKEQVFQNAEELRIAIYKFSLAHGFDYKFV